MLYMVEFDIVRLFLECHVYSKLSYENNTHKILLTKN